LPTVIQRARIFEHVLANRPIDIGTDEFIVGSINDCFSNSYDLYLGGKENPLSKEAPADVKAAWASDPYEKAVKGLLTADEAAAHEEQVCIGKRVTAHIIPDFEKALKAGLGGIIAEAQELRGRAASTDGRFHSPKDFYEAVIISCHAAIALAHRYRDLARRRGLTRIAEVCDRVPEHPARGFHEALQCVWFVFELVTLEQSPNAYALSVGRLDQFAWPCYERDIASGALTREQALELLEALWLKFMVGRSAWAVSQNILVGGVTADGRDASNELTLLALEATEDLRVPQPSVALRWHPNLPERVVDKALQVLKLGLGIPAIHFDPNVLTAMTRMGYSAEDARNYVIAGCQEFCLPGCDNSRTTAGKLNLAKCLELALNDGVSTVSGKRLGPQTGEPAQLASFEHLLAAFQAQLRFFVDMMVRCHNKSDLLIARERPTPFLSAVMADCLKKGVDVRSDGARWNFSGCLVHGLGTVVDSLFAIKKLVFDEQRVTLVEMAEALRTDWRGQEMLRQLCLHGVAKYGNDDEDVDALAPVVAKMACDDLQARTNAWGGRWKAGFNTPSTHVHYGYATGATPDGRRKGDPLSYGSGPMQGVTRHGPTAIIKSVTRFDHTLAGQGTDLNLSLHPTALEGDDGLAKLRSLIRTLGDRGANHVQVNVVTAKALRDAQQHPEQYADLVVRVHGFSTFFTALARDIQDDLIARTESGL
ncbi:MAG: hypothetical protein FJ278_11945, partial [Planctomycetes bacterium]|nr:hypothetical protein [Planctomycetota bacterium]